MIVENVPASMPHVRAHRLRVWSRPHCSTECLKSPCIAKDIKMDILHDLLGQDYLLYQLHVCPADAGYFGTQRTRTYIFFCHKRRCRHLCDIHEAYRKVTKTLRHHIFTRPRDYLVASKTEILLAAERASRSRNIPFKPVPWPLCVTCP